MGILSYLLPGRSSSESGYRQLPAAESGADTPYHLPGDDDDQDDGVPLIKTGVEGSLAWQRMSSKEKSLVFFTFGLLGMGVLLPFNSLITPTEYFRSSFSATEFATTFSSWIAASYNVISILFGFHATATGGFERSSPRRRIIASSLVIMFAILCFIISTIVHLSSDKAQIMQSPQAYFYFTLFLSFLLSSATAYLQNAVVALSTAFGCGGKFMGIMLSGQGIVGVGISIVGIISAWSQSTGDDHLRDHQLTPSEETANEIAKAATMFFTMSLLLMAFVLAVFCWLARSQLYAEVMAKEVASIDKIDDDNEEDDSDVETNGMTQSWHSVRSISHPHYCSILKRIPGFKLLSHESRQSLLRLASVQSKIAWDCFAIAYIFAITLSIYPAVTSSIQSVYTLRERNGFKHGRPSSPDLTLPQLFVPFHFLLFNLSDLAGRTLPSLTTKALLKKGGVLVMGALTRTVLVPLFLTCNVASRSQRTGPISAGERDGPHGLAALMQSSDAPFFTLMLIFGLTNGLFSTGIMISGPKRGSLINSKGASEGPLAATLLSFWLCMGLAAGSGLSFLTASQYM